jgi:DNA-binding GntR family transcriptional regulator
MIGTLELPPGSVVTEAALCSLLRCSRTPLREALPLLARDHLVIPAPRGGVSIPSLTIADFVAMVEAIDGVEGVIVELTATRVTKEALRQLAELQDASAAAAAAGDLASVIDLDFRFHHLIGEASGNPLLEEIQDSLHRVSMRFAFLGLRRAGSADGLLEDHRRILEALREGDPVAAAAAAHDHTAHARERMRAAL